MALMAATKYAQLPINVGGVQSPQRSYSASGGSSPMESLANAVNTLAKKKFSLISSKYDAGQMGDSEFLNFVLQQYNSALSEEDKYYWENKLVESREKVQANHYRRVELEIDARYKRGEISDQQYWNALNALKEEADMNGDTVKSLQYDLKLARFESKKSGSGGGSGQSVTKALNELKYQWKTDPETGSIALDRLDVELEDRFKRSQEGDIPEGSPDYVSDSDYALGRQNLLSLQAAATNNKLATLTNLRRQGYIDDKKFLSETDSFYKEIGLDEMGNPYGSSFRKDSLLDKYTKIQKDKGAKWVFDAPRISEKVKAGKAIGPDDLFTGIGKTPEFYTAKYFAMPSRAMSPNWRTDALGIPIAEDVQRLQEYGMPYERKRALAQFSKPGGMWEFFKGEYSPFVGPVRDEYKAKNIILNTLTNEAAGGAGSFIGANKNF